MSFFHYLSQPAQRCLLCQQLTMRPRTTRTIKVKKTGSTFSTLCFSKCGAKILARPSKTYCFLTHEIASHDSKSRQYKYAPTNSRLTCWKFSDSDIIVGTIIIATPKSIRISPPKKYTVPNFPGVDFSID